ncbi:hypothetical protein IT774_09935 [Salinimonas marina]|uniref:Uncharacterized protein n=1 Tax=Salinimonas marina TaxID=2785918 RepID=A0A7S9DV61_9ALTE|nr:hypothetical protein [Salinimonas marina]QPG04559.1 hypothetical protein IT774_09935 [Salinimonas marina]
MQKKNYEAEWCLLQNQFESYEKHSLYIKLSSIVLVFLTVALGVSPIFICLLLLVLWLQDAIWKTFQSRLEPRLLKIEKNIREEIPAGEFQFNSDYQLLETGGLSKVLEYAKQATRPTIAFPYVVLLVMLIIQGLVA